MAVNSSGNSVILILFAFSDNLSAENSKLSADSWNRGNHLFGCMTLSCDNYSFDHLHPYAGPDGYPRVLDYSTFEFTTLPYSKNFTTRSSSRVVTISSFLSNHSNIQKMEMWNFQTLSWGLFSPVLIAAEAVQLLHLKQHLLRQLFQLPWIRLGSFY